MENSSNIELGFSSLPSNDVYADQGKGKTYIVMLSALIIPQASDSFKWADPQFTEKFIKMIASRGNKLIVVGDGAENYEDAIKSVVGDIEIELHIASKFNSANDIAETWTNQSDEYSAFNLDEFDPSEHFTGAPENFVFMGDSMIDVQAAEQFAAASICLDTKLAWNNHVDALAKAQLELTETLLDKVDLNYKKLLHLSQQQLGVTAEDTIQRNDTPVTKVTKKDQQFQQRLDKNVNQLMTMMQKYSAELQSFKESPSDGKGTVDHHQIYLLLEKTTKLLEISSLSVTNAENKRGSDYSQANLPELENIDKTINEKRVVVATLISHPTTLTNYRGELIDTLVGDMSLTKQQIQQILRNVAKTHKTTSFLGQPLSWNATPEKGNYYRDKDVRELVNAVYKWADTSKLELKELYKILLERDIEAKTSLTADGIRAKFSYAELLLNSALGVIDYIPNDARLAHHLLFALGQGYKDPMSIKMEISGETFLDEVDDYYDDSLMTAENDTDEVEIPEQLKVLKINASDITEILKDFSTRDDRKSSSTLGKVRGTMFSPYWGIHYSNKAIQDVVNQTSSASAKDVMKFSTLYTLLKDNSDNGEVLAKVLLDSARQLDTDGADKKDSLAEDIAHAIGQKFAKVAQPVEDNVISYQ